MDVLFNACSIIIAINFWVGWQNWGFQGQPIRRHPHIGKNVKGCKSRPLPTSNVCHYHMPRSVIRWKYQFTCKLSIKMSKVTDHITLDDTTVFFLPVKAHLLYNLPNTFLYTVFLNTIEQQDYLEHVKRIRKNNISLCTYRVVDIEYHISIPYK